NLHPELLRVEVQRLVLVVDPELSVCELDHRVSYVRQYCAGTLIARRPAVFSKRAVLRTAVEAGDAGRDQRLLGRRRELRAISGRRDPVGAREARRERADALQSDREADVRHGAVGCSQQRRGALQPPGEQVGMRGLPVRATELTAEMRSGEASGASEIIDPKRLEVSRVGEILGPKEVAGWRDEGHRSGYRARQVVT